MTRRTWSDADIERDAEHFQRSAAGDIGQRRWRLDAVSTSVVVEHDFSGLGPVEPQVVVSCPCCYVAKLSNTRISTGGGDHQVRVICKLYEAVAGVQKFEVCGSDGVRSRTNAGTLNDVGRYRFRGRHLALVHGPVVLNVSATGLFYAVRAREKHQKRPGAPHNDNTY